MSNPIRDSFDHIHASESLKQHTKDFLTYQLVARRRRTVKRLCAALACLLPLLFGTYWIYFQPVAVISVDVNPSIELGINRLDRVIWVKGYNESGQALAQTFSVRFMNYATALHEILSDQQLSSYLQDDDDEISVLVISQTADSDMIQQVESCAAEHQQTTCHAATMHEVEQAHEMRLSYGKYIAFLELQALEPAFTPDDVRNMTMREIRDLIARLSVEDTSTPEPVPAPEENEQNVPAATSSDTHEHGTGHQYHGKHHH